MKKNKNNEFNPYATDKLAKIPSWIKILFLKYWVAAATLFFFGIGNPILMNEGETYTPDYILPLYIFLALGLAIFNEYITKHMVRLMHTSKDNTYRLNMINLKGMKSLLLNILYAFVIMIPMISILVFLASHNLVLDFLSDSGEKAAVEPFTGGFVYLLVDGIALGIKNLIIYIYKTNKYKKINQRNEELIKKLETLSDEELIKLDIDQMGVANEV